MVRIERLTLWLCAFLIIQNCAFASEGLVCNIKEDIVVTDYRDRSTPQLRWNIQDNMAAHLQPAMERMANGEYSRRVMADINWTLLRYPNHQVGLDALIKYALAGGQIYEFYSPDCYLELAQTYYPDDDKVALARGYYFWKIGEASQAKDAYENASRINPASSSANYNLGLIYFEEKKYIEASRYASIAYSLGYPLSGLREKLFSVGINLTGSSN